MGVTFSAQNPVTKEYRDEEYVHLCNANARLILQALGLESEELMGRIPVDELRVRVRTLETAFAQGRALDFGRPDETVGLNWFSFGCNPWQVLERVRMIRDLAKGLQAPWVITFA